MRVHADEPLQGRRGTVRSVVEGFGADYFRNRYRRRAFPENPYDELADRGWLGVTLPASASGRGDGSRRLTAQAKLKAGETLKAVAADGIQVLGGASPFPENDMEHYWREGASTTIAGGTSGIQRSIISRDMRADRE